MAILNYVSGQDRTAVQLIASGLPLFPVGGAFEVVLHSPSHTETQLFFFTADNHGAATLHISADGDWSDSDITIEDDGVLVATGLNPN